MALVGTYFQAMLAADTKFLIECDFRLKIDGFGVMTPETAERTAFKKDCRPNPWPIMDRKMLNIEDTSCYMQIHTLNVDRVRKIPRKSQRADIF
jgi:hypothetical protein